MIESARIAKSGSAWIIARNLFRDSLHSKSLTIGSQLLKALSPQTNFQRGQAFLQLFYLFFRLGTGLHPGDPAAIIKLKPQRAPVSGLNIPG